MGSFLHSLHVRSSDQAGVQRVLEAMDGTESLRAWVSPAVNGWVSVLPEEMAAVLTAGSTLSKGCKAHVLATLVHDSDVFIYVLFRDGKKVEEYESEPDYFATKSKKTPTPRVTPQRVLELLPQPKDAAAIISLLTGEMPDFADDLLNDFLDRFGIKYGSVTYDDLITEDGGQISRRREFRHVPDLGAEKAAKKSAKEKLSAAKRALQAAGQLVFDSDLGRNSRAWRRPFEILGPAAGGGFLVLHFGEWEGLMRWDPPADPTGFAPLPGITGIECGPTLPDKRIVVCRSGEGAGSVDPATGKFTLRHRMGHGWPMAHDPSTDLVYILAFGGGPDDSDALLAVQWRDGKVKFTAPLTRGVRDIIIHPTQPHLIWIDQGKLGVLDKRTGASIYESETYNESLAPKKKAQWLAAGDANPGGGRVSERDLFMREMFFSIAFDSSGEWLIAGTSEGLRFYPYASLLAQTGVMPSPTIALETCVVLQDYRYVYDLLLDDSGTHVIYTCGDDSIRCFDWVRRIDRELKPSTEAKKIFRLVRSGDGRHLACRLVYRGDDWKRHQDESWVQVWDYAALLRTGTLPSA